MPFERDTSVPSSSAPVHLLGWDFFGKYHVRDSFSQKEIILEFDHKYQSSQAGELNDTLTSFICYISDDTRTDSGNSEHLSILNQVPHSLQAKSPIDIGKIHSIPPIKIQIDPWKHLPGINQWPISNGALQGIKPIIEDYKAQGFVISCTSPCNTPILLMRKT